LDSQQANVPGSQPRSPFKSRISYVDGESTVTESKSTPSVLRASGPLLSTPLLPKIKRAIELNDSYR
jgi:hypothetical protein